MPLNSLNLTISPSWTLQKTTSGFQATTEGPDSTGAFSLAGVSTTLWNQAWTNQYTIISGQTQTVNLLSGQNLVSENFSFGHVLSTLVTTSGAAVKVSTSDSLHWFLTSGGGIILNDGSCFAWSDRATASGASIVSGTCTMTLNNCSGGTAVCTFEVFGTTS